MKIMKGIIIGVTLGTIIPIAMEKESLKSAKCMIKKCKKRIKNFKRKYCY